MLSLGYFSGIIMIIIMIVIVFYTHSRVIRIGIGMELDLGVEVGRKRWLSWLLGSYYELRKSEGSEIKWILEFPAIFYSPIPHFWPYINIKANLFFTLIFDRRSGNAEQICDPVFIYLALRRLRGKYGLFILLLEILMLMILYTLS